MRPKAKALGYLEAKTHSALSFSVEGCADSSEIQSSFPFGFVQGQDEGFLKINLALLSGACWQKGASGMGE